jgi:hypothetical protein
MLLVPTTFVVILVMLGTAGLIALGLFAVGNYNKSQEDKENSVRTTDSPAEVPEYRQENERYWLGEESRNVWRVQQSGAPEPAQPSRHWNASKWTNRPLTPQEEMEVRQRYADLLDETLRYKLPDRNPLNISRDPWANRQRGLGAHHPGLTRVEVGPGGEVPKLPDSLAPYQYGNLAEEARGGIPRRRLY